MLHVPLKGFYFLQDLQDLLLQFLHNVSIFKWTALELDQAVFAPKGICLIWRLICDELPSSTNNANPPFSFYCLISISGSLFNTWLQHGKMRKWALLTLTSFAWCLLTKWILSFPCYAMFTAQNAALNEGRRFSSKSPLQLRVTLWSWGRAQYRRVIIRVSHKLKPFVFTSFYMSFLTAVFFLILYISLIWIFLSTVIKHEWKKKEVAD